MSTPTPRIRLKSPSGTDPFIRQDFVDNFDLIDDYASLFPCTSTSHPTGWGANQNGLLIHEIDTGAVLRWVNGQGFKTLSNYARAKAYRVTPNITIAPGSTFTQNLGSLTVPRACVAMVQGVVSTTGGNLTLDLLLDGVSIQEAARTVSGDQFLYGAAGLSPGSTHTLTVTVGNASTGQDGKDPTPLTFSKVFAVLTLAEVDGP